MSRSDRLTTIEVEVTQETGGDVRISWKIPQERSGWDPYTVSGKNIEDLGKAIRESLKDLVSHCHRQGDVKTCKPLLKEVARQGRELYLELFNIVEDQDMGFKIMDGLEERSDNHRIDFTVDRSLNIPWGLIYSSDPSKLDEGEGPPDFDDYKDFWCNKYSLSTSFGNIPPQKIPDSSLKGDEFIILPAFNQEAFDTAFRALMDGEKDSIYDLFYSACVPTHSKEEFLNQWEKVAEQNGIIYYYGHANGTKLEFSKLKGQIVTARELNRRRNRNQDVIRFAFFNGCATAGETQDASFMEALKRNGVRGFIGTETKVPDVFALRFGFEFLSHFLGGESSMVDAMSELRKKHWPLSIIYGNYCRASFYIKPRADHFLAKLGSENFSHGTLGSNLLGI